MVQTAPERKSMSSASGCNSRLWMTNRSWDKFIPTRICVLRFSQKAWRCARFFKPMCWLKSFHHLGAITETISSIKKNKDLTLQEQISHMRTEEANRLKDKMSSLSLNSVNPNLVESAVPTNKDRFKAKERNFRSQIIISKTRMLLTRNSEAQGSVLCVRQAWT